jgi:presenilin-like A22 family membrane protease
MKLYITLLLMFIATQLLGLYTGSYILEDALTNPYVRSMMTIEAGPTAIPYFIISVLLGAFIFLLLHRLHISLLFTLLEITVISTTTSIFIYAFIKPVLVATLESMVVAIGLAILFAILKQFFHKLKNLAAITSSAGAGAVFGFTFGFTNALIFLLILAIYDYVSVYKTKHMITMANEIVKRDMAFTISAEHTYPFGKKARLDLGTGDISLPIMAEVSAYAISPVLSAFVLGGAIAGTLFVLYVAWRHKCVLPALPPIAAGIFLFSLIAIFFGFVS